jgi:hypothetical protein
MILDRIYVYGYGFYCSSEIREAAEATEVQKSESRQELDQEEGAKEKKVRINRLRQSAVG